MTQKGRADDVLVVTTSEFGRRVAENGSGTDHGEASVHFLAGGQVNGGQVVGTADLATLDDGDLPLADRHPLGLRHRAGLARRTHRRDPRPAGTTATIWFASCSGCRA